MANTPLSICNQALIHIGGGDQPQIADFAEGSAASIAASLLYPPAVQFTLRQLKPRFATKIVALSTTANTPLPPWTVEYLYPADCLSISGLKPATSTNDPKPNLWKVAVATVSSVPTTVIWAKLASARLVYTSSTVLGALTADASVAFDSIFQEALVRNLASAFAEALSGRFDTAKEKLSEWMDAVQLADFRADAA